MSLLGTLVVKIAAELGRYKADLEGAASTTNAAAANIDQSTRKVGESSRKGFGEAGAAAEQSAQKVVEASRHAVDASAQQVSAMGLLRNAARDLGVVYAAYKMVDLIRDSTMLASRFETMGVVMRVAGNNAGYTMEQMTGFSKSLQQSGISMLQSRNSLTQLATANVDLANASKLARAAQDLAVVGNVNSSDALARMIQGIKSGEVEILKTLGLNVSFEGSYKTLASQLGTTSDKLTENQKVMARTDATLSESARYAGIYEESMTTAGKAVTSLTRYWEDFKIKAGDAFLPGLATFVFNLTDALKAMNAEMDKAGQSGTISSVAGALNGVLKTALETVTVLAANVAYTISMVVGEIKTLATQAVAVAHLDFKGAAGISSEWIAESNAARAALDAFEKKILQVGETTKKASATTEAQRIASGRASRDAADALNAEAKAAEAKAKAGKGAASAYAQATKQANEYIQSLKNEAQEAGLTAEQTKMLSAARAAGKAPTAALRVEIMQAALALTIAAKAEKDAADAAKVLAKAQEEARKQSAQYYDAIGKDITAQEESNTKLREQNEEIGLTAEALTALRLARLDEAIAQKEQTLAMQSMHEASAEELLLLKKKIDQLKEARGLTANGAAATSYAKSAADAVDEWKKASDSINSTLTDALMRGFESGKGFLKNLRDTAVNMFKTLILRPTISAVMNPIAQGITGAMGLSGAAQAGQGMGALNAASGLSSLYGAGASIVSIGGQVAAGTMGIANALGTIAANATGTGISGLLATNGAYGTAAGAAGAGGVMSGITGAMAAIPVWGWVALAAAAVFSFAKGGETRNGATYGTGADGKATILQGPSGGEIAGDKARTMFDTTQTAIKDMLAALGSKSVLTGFTAGLESSKENKGFAFAGGMIDGKGFGENLGRDGGQFSMGDKKPEEAMAAYTVELKQAVVQALQAAADIPKTITDMLAGVDAQALDASGVDSLLTSISNVVSTDNGFRTAVESLPFEYLRGQSFDAAAGLIAAAGGMDTLSAGLTSYYDNFFTDAEKTANLTANTAMAFAALGVTMPAITESTKDWYKSELERLGAMDLSIESNARAYAGFLRLNGSISTLAGGAAAAADSIRKAVSGISASVDASLFNMQYGMADDPGKYSMLDVKAAGYNDQMMGASDINDIAAFAQKTIDAINQSFALLSPEQQKSSYLGFEDRLEDIDTFVQTKGADAISLQGARDDKTAATIAAAVEVAVAKAMEASAKQISDAALAMAAAADKPAQANITVSVVKPPGVEVSIAGGDYA